MIERCELQEIEKLQHLNRAELKKLLDRLVSLDLISVYKGHYRPLHQGKFKWADQSKLAKTLNNEWSELTLQRALQDEKSSLHRLISMKLSEDSYQELLKKLFKTLDEAVQNSEQEELTLSKERRKNFAALVAVTSKGVFDS